MPKDSKRDKKTKHTRKQETRTSNQYPGRLKENCQGYKEMGAQLMSTAVSDNEFKHQQSGQKNFPKLETEN